MPPIIPRNRGPIEELLARLDGVKQAGKGWIALCPAHPDNNPSLSISRGADGRALLHCFAGCEVKEILAAVGMKLPDLFRASATSKYKSNDKPSGGKTYPTWEAAMNALDNHCGQRSGTWQYRDAGGKVVAVVGRWPTRLRDGTECKTYRPVSLHNDGWRIKDPPGLWPLYPLPEITAAKESLTVVVEGEKCADAAASIGLLATTSAHGAQSADKTDWTPLAGRNVLIFPDNDPAGMAYARAVALILFKLSPPARVVKIVDLPGLGDGEDIFDFIAARNKAGKKASEIRQEILDLAENTKPKSQLAALIGSIKQYATDEIVIGSKDGPPPDVRAASMADVMKRIDGIKYLVPKYIPFGMLSMIVAEPGRGKSSFALWLTRTVITGGDWFSGAKGPAKPGFVLWCDTEGSAAMNVDRIKNWGLPAEGIKVPFEDEPLLPINLHCEEHLARIEAVIVKYRIQLVVIDSLRGAHGGDENNSQVAQVLQRLAVIAERTNAAIVIVHHTKKLMLEEDICANSSRGSNAILAMVRAQLGIDKPDAKSDWCRLQMLKENLGLKPRPIGFRISSKGLEFGPAPKRPHKETEKDRAEEWLKAHMEPGRWYKAADLEDEAKQDGISDAALRRARNDLGIVKPHCLRKTKDGWEWRLPGDGKAAGKTPRETVTP
jgi:hypothetical protein